MPLGVARSPTCRPARRASSRSRWREAAAQCSTSRFCWLLHTSVSARTPLHALIFHPPHCTSRRNTCKSSGGKHEAPRARRCLPPLFLPPFCRAPCAQLLSAMHLLRAAQCQHTPQHCSAPCTLFFFGDFLEIRCCLLGRLFSSRSRLAALAKPFGLVGVHTGVSLATLATLPLCSTHGVEPKQSQ